MTTNQAIAIAFPVLTAAMLWAFSYVLVRKAKRKKAEREQKFWQELDRTFDADAEVTEILAEKALRRGTFTSQVETEGVVITDKTGRPYRVNRDEVLEQVERLVHAVRVGTGSKA